MKVRWKEFIIALMLAATLWYGVTGSEKVSTQVTVRVDYKGMPPNLTVLDGLVDKLTVRVLAPAGLLRSVQEREYTFSMDLSTLVKGENILPIALGQLPLRSGVEVIEIIPSRLQVNVDSITTKKLPLIAEMQGELPVDMLVNTEVDPDEVTVRGPSSLVDGMKKVHVLVPVGNQTAGVQKVKRLLALPDGVDAKPQEVEVSVQFAIKRKLVHLTRQVSVSRPENLGIYSQPEKVSITLAMPESQAAKAAFLNEVQASATLPGYSLGSYSLPVHVHLPDGAELVNVEPKDIVVILEQPPPQMPQDKGRSRKP